MLDQMSGQTLGEIARKAVEELFEAQNDREFARLCIEDDINVLLNTWENLLGTNSSSTVTSTEDGFRVSITILKDYDG